MTKLSPLEEVLFQAWSRAQGIDNHDDPKNMFDHRGLYKQSNGMVLPRGFINGLAQSHNAAMEPQETGDQADPWMAQAEIHKANLDSQSKQRADQLKLHLSEKTHEQKIQLEQMKQQHQAAEKQKDREMKMQQHLVQQQMRQQQAQEQMQQKAQMNEQQLSMKAQMGQQQMAQKQQMGEQQMQQKSQLQSEQLDHQATQADQDRQLQASQPQPEAAPQGGGGLEQQLMQRQGM